jgi:hypothetical protein
MKNERVAPTPRSHGLKHWSSRSLLALLVLAIAPACGGDDPAEGEGEGNGGSQSPAGAGGSTNECKSLKAPTIVVDEISLDDFAVDGEDLFFIDPDMGTLEKRSTKGGAGSTLVEFDSAAQFGPSVFVDGADLYVHLGGIDDDEDNLPIQRVSRTGGSLSKLTNTSVGTGSGIFAADDSSLYATDWGTFITRISKSTGEVQYVVKDYPELASPQLYDGKIYFADMENGDIRAVDKGASESTGEVVIPEACMILYSLAIGKERVACGLDVFDWQGEKTNFLDTSGRLAHPSGPIWFGYSNDDHTISQVKFDPFESKLLACDVNSNISVVHPSGNDVYYLNVRTVNKQSVRSINRLSAR